MLMGMVAAGWITTCDSCSPGVLGATTPVPTHPTQNPRPSVSCPVYCPVRSTPTKRSEDNAASLFHSSKTSCSPRPTNPCKLETHVLFLPCGVGGMCVSGRGSRAGRREGFKASVMSTNQQLASQLCCYLDTILVSTSTALDKTLDTGRPHLQLLTKKKYLHLESMDWLVVIYSFWTLHFQTLPNSPFLYS